MNGVYVLIALLVGFGAAQVWLTWRRGEMTEAGWRLIREIIYATIDDVVALYQAAELGADEVTATAVRIIRARIAAAEIDAADKAFWTEERIRRFVAPVLEALLRPGADEPNGKATE